MKKILSLVIVLLAVGQLSAKGIEPKSPLGMSVIKQGFLVKVFYRAEEIADVKVTIYNQSGAIVYREALDNTTNFMRPYNFSSLPAGEYTIELADGQGKRYEKVTHSAKNNVRVAHLTRLNDSESTYVLAVPNRGQDELLVTIYDDKNAIVYQHKELIKGDFAKVYNLESIAGEHTFVISDKKGKINRLSKPLR